VATLDERSSANRRREDLAPLLLCAGVATALAGLLAVPLIAFADFPALLLPAIPAAVAAAVTLVWNTQLGLCFAAFAIAPLGIVQHEIAEVTLNLPEVLILILVAKEAIRFIAQGERPVDFLPAKTLAFYLVASIAAIATGLMRDNGLVPVLQDFRQFTEYVILYLLVLHRVSSPKQMSAIMACYVFGCTAIAVHAIVQRFTGMGIPIEQLASDAVLHGETRSGSFYGATPLGGLMVLAVGAGISMLLFSRSYIKKSVFAACIATCLVAAVFSYTRASWLAMVVSFAVIFLSVKKTPLMAAVAIAVVLSFAIVLGPMVVKRMHTLSFSKAERSLHQRVQYYTTAWYIFRDYPVRGLGWGCYYEVQSILVNRRYVRVRDFSEQFDAEKGTVHSAYLQLLAKAGLLGLVSFLMFLLTWLRRVWQERFVTDRDERVHNLFIGLAGGLIGYLLHSGLENFFQWPVMAQSFWLFMGLATVMAHGLLKAGGRIEPAPAQLETGKA